MVEFPFIYVQTIWLKRVMGLCGADDSNNLKMRFYFVANPLVGITAKETDLSILIYQESI